LKTADAKNGIQSIIATLWAAHAWLYPLFPLKMDFRSPLCRLVGMSVLIENQQSLAEAVSLPLGESVKLSISQNFHPFITSFS